MFSHQKGKNDRQRTLDACKSFACEPWIAVYVETSGHADLYLTSLNNYDKKYCTKKGEAIDDWKMTNRAMAEYEKDKNIKHVRMNFNMEHWAWQ